MDNNGRIEEPELHNDPTLQGEGEEGGRAAGVAVKHQNDGSIMQYNARSDPTDG